MTGLLITRAFVLRLCFYLHILYRVILNVKRHILSHRCTAHMSAILACCASRHASCTFIGSGTYRVICPGISVSFKKACLWDEYWHRFTDVLKTLKSSEHWLTSSQGHHIAIDFPLFLVYLDYRYFPSLVSRVI